MSEARRNFVILVVSGIVAAFILLIIADEAMKRSALLSEPTIVAESDTGSVGSTQTSQQTQPAAVPTPAVAPKPVVVASQTIADKVSVEWAVLTTSDKATCTKLRVFLRNNSDQPITVKGIWLDESRYLDMHSFLELVDGFPPAPPLELDTDPPVENNDPTKPIMSDPNKSYILPTGTLQWHRTLPNPIPPGSVSEAEVSLWGIVPKASLQIEFEDASKLPLAMEETNHSLRFSQIIFDPVDPNKIYIYCKNTSHEKKVVVNSLQVGNERVEPEISIGDKEILPYGGACFVVKTKHEQMTWGRYVSVSATGSVVAPQPKPIPTQPVAKPDEEFLLKRDQAYAATLPPHDAAVFLAMQARYRKADQASSKEEIREVPEATEPRAMAMVRVMNFFPVGAWDYDMRREMYFDTEDMKGQIRKEARTWPPAANGRPWRAYCPIRDINMTKPWNKSALAMLQEVNKAQIAPGSPAIYTNILEPLRPNIAAHFGELGDFIMFNAYRSRTAGAINNGRAVEYARNWTDPRPMMVAPEVFTVKDRDYWKRELTPLEVKFSTWAEVGAGAKGVSYYRSKGADKSGFSFRPAIERAVKDLNLDLQLLRPFLRIGDTVASQVTVLQDGTFNGGPMPPMMLDFRTVLCGDKGMVVFIFDPAGPAQVPAAGEWTVLHPKNAMVGTMDMRPARIFRVDKGFREKSGSYGGHSLIFDPDPLFGFAVYLIVFDQSDKVKSSSYVQASPLPEVEAFTESTPEELLKAFQSRMNALMADMLDPWRDVECESAVKIGLTVTATREAALKRLMEIEPNRDAEAYAILGQGKT